MIWIDQERSLSIPLIAIKLTMESIVLPARNALLSVLEATSRVNSSASFLGTV